jgi:hypothetical protein
VTTAVGEAQSTLRLLILARESSKSGSVSLGVISSSAARWRVLMKSMLMMSYAE